MKYCINCRHTLSDDAEFCPKCGLKTEGVALCEHCKQYVYFEGNTLVGTNIYNKTGVKYCRNCGASMSDWEITCPECNEFMPCQAECGNCSGSSHAQGQYYSHQVDSDYQGGTYNNSSYTYYDDTPPKRVNKGTQTAIKIFLIIAILGIVFGSLDYFFGTSALQEVFTEVFAELALDPEMQEVLGSIDQAQLESFMQIISIVSGVFALIPLAWVLPMRKKILKAMNEGTTLSTGFKICTLFFVSFIVGILLLCSQDI